MQDTNISLRATKKDKKLHARAAKVAGNKQKAVIAGLHHVAKVCSICGESLKDGYFRSEGAPVCHQCAATKDIKIDVENDY